MDSNDAIAESYLRQQELDGDPYGEKFNGGVDLIPVSSMSGQEPYRTDFDAADPVGGRDDDPDAGKLHKVVTTNPVPDADVVYRQKIDWGRLHADEDPLFKRIAGDSNEFVGGIPKETWDGLSQEQKDRLVRGTEEDRRAAGYAGAVTGGIAGFTASLPAMSSGPVGWGLATSGLTTLGGVVGYNTGYDLLDKATPPQPSARDRLREQFERAKDHD